MVPKETVVEESALELLACPKLGYRMEYFVHIAYLTKSNLRMKRVILLTLLGKSGQAQQSRSPAQRQELCRGHGRGRSRVALLLTAPLACFLKEPSTPAQG